MGKSYHANKHFLIAINTNFFITLYSYISKSQVNNKPIINMP